MPNAPPPTSLFARHTNQVVRHEYRGQKRIGGFRRGVYFPLGDLHNRFKSKGKDLAANNLQLKQTVVYDSSPFYHRWVMGGVVIVSFIAVVVSVTISLLVLRVTLRDVNPTYGGIAGGTIISVVIAIMNFVYGKVAVLLTNWENHRTESQYSGALITKMFVFQFVNSYSSLFYVAFMVNTDILSSFFPDSPRQTCVEEQIGSGSDRYPLFLFCWLLVVAVCCCGLWGVCSVAIARVATRCCTW